MTHTSAMFNNVPVNYNSEHHSRRSGVLIDFTPTCFIETLSQIINLYTLDENHEKKTNDKRAKILPTLQTENFEYHSKGNGVLIDLTPNEPSDTVNINQQNTQRTHHSKDRYFQRNGKAQRQKREQNQRNQHNQRNNAKIQQQQYQQTTNKFWNNQ